MFGPTASIVKFPNLIAVRKSPRQVIVLPQICSQRSEMVSCGISNLIIQARIPANKSHVKSRQRLDGVLNLLGPRVVSGPQEWYAARIS